MSKRLLGLPSTMWTDIDRWKRASPTEKRESLERFYANYQLPLIAFIRNQGYSVPDAEDIMQDFVIDHVDGKLFATSDRARGRFRNLLLTALKNFLSSRHRANTAQKRRPRFGFESLDREIVEGVTLSDLLPDNCTPDYIYHRTWLITLLNNSLTRFRIEYEEKGRSTHVELYAKRVVNPIIQGDAKPSVANLAVEYDVTPEYVSNSLTTSRRAFERSLRQEVREYVSSEKDVSQEISDLFEMMRESSG